MQRGKLEKGFSRIQGEQFPHSEIEVWLETQGRKRELAKYRKKGKLGKKTASRKKWSSGPAVRRKREKKSKAKKIRKNS